MATPRYAARPLSNHDDWARADKYHNDFLHAPDEALDAAVRATAEAGIPAINVSAAQGKFLNLLLRSIQGKRVLEVGTLGGYSSIWMARALPDDGELITLEISAKHAEVARRNIARAGLESKVKVIVGAALDSLPTLPSEKKFDLAFIDADKDNNPSYYEHAKRLVRKGGVIVVDNVVRNGRVSDPAQNTSDVIGVRNLLEMVKNDSGVDATTLGTVGEKGWDGFLYAYVK